MFATALGALTISLFSNFEFAVQEPPVRDFSPLTLCNEFNSLRIEYEAEIRQVLCEEYVAIPHLYRHPCLFGGTLFGRRLEAAWVTNFQGFRRTSWRKSESDQWISPWRGERESARRSARISADVDTSITTAGNPLMFLILQSAHILAL